MHVLRGGRVVDVDGVREADVGIDRGRIAAVGDVDVDDDTTETDVSGQFVAPGLVDAHVHLMMDGRPDVTTIEGESEATAAYRAAANLEAALDAGVTTVRDLGARDSLALDAAGAVEAGVLDGPRVLAAGQNIVMTGGHGHWFGREADGETAVRRATREQLKRGADVVKCMATGGVLTAGAKTGLPELTREELDALVDAAASKGVPTAAHAHGKEGIDNAVRAGITSVEHGTFMDRETADLMADRGTYWVPTTAALVGIVDNGVEGDIPAETVAKAEEAAVAHGRAFEHALDAGVPLAMGTDAGTPFNFFADIPRELELLVDRGLTPEHALEAATVNAAALLGLDDVGTVSEGARADLVALAENPLDDVGAWRHPTTVVADGDVVR